jgi:hypothetical protein
VAGPRRVEEDRQVEEGARGHVVVLGETRRLAADEEDDVAREDRGRVAGARRVHVGSGGERVRRRIVDLGGRDDAARRAAAGHEHAPVGEHRRGVVVPRGEQRRAGRHPARRRIVDLRPGKRAAGVAAAHDQDPSVGERRRRVSPPRRDQRRALNRLHHRDRRGNQDEQRDERRPEPAAACARQA